MLRPTQAPNLYPFEVLQTVITTPHFQPSAPVPHRRSKPPHPHIYTTSEMHTLALGDRPAQGWAAEATEAYEGLHASSGFSGALINIQAVPQAIPHRPWGR